MFLSEKCYSSETAGLSPLSLSFSSKKISKHFGQISHCNSKVYEESIHLKMCFKNLKLRKLCVLPLKVCLPVR